MGRLDSDFDWSAPIISQAHQNRIGISGPITAKDHSNEAGIAP
jgi:hypothetical protein